MAAIIRVKRKAQDIPASSFIVSCKRLKTFQNSDLETNIEGDVRGLFKFAATVPDKENTTQFVKKALTKEKLEKELKQHDIHSSELLKKNKDSHKLRSISNRFKVISKKRSGKFEELDKATDQGSEAEELKRFQLYDITADDEEDERSQAAKKKSLTKGTEVFTCNDVPMIREKVKPSTEAEKYVYDLYYLNQSNFDFKALENILAIEAFQAEELTYDDYRDDTEEVYDDEDDENEESNWRNDYPDEDPDYYETNYSSDGFGAYASENDCDPFTDFQQKLSLQDEDFLENFSQDDEDIWHPAASYKVYKQRILKTLNMDDS